MSSIVSITASMARVRGLICVLVYLGTAISVIYAQCSVYTETAGMTGNQLERNGFSTAPDIAACQAYCSTNANCVAVDFQSSTNNCFPYPTSQTSQLTASADITYSEQNCPATTAAAATATTAAATATTAGVPPAGGSCTMAQTVDTKGGLTNIQLFLTNIDQCSAACLYITQCQGAAYVAGTCQLYTGTVSDTNTGDDVHFVKGTCSTGTPCCMTGTTTMKADNTSPFLSVTSSLATCEAVCLATSNCLSVYYYQNVCYIYTSATTTSGQTGSTYSVKSCPSGDSATETISYECVDLHGTGVRSKVAGYLVLAAILVTTAT